MESGVFDEVFVAFDDIGDYFGCGDLWKTAFSSEKLEKIAVGTVLCDDVAVAVGFLDAVAFDYVRVIQFSQDFDFVIQHLHI